MSDQRAKSPSPPLPFDEPDYLHSLPHIGAPLPGQRALLVRKIPGTAQTDLMGSWPYTSPPDDWERLASELAGTGAVSLVAVIRPDYHLDHEGAARAGAMFAPLKQHHVFDPALQPPTLSSKARSNLSIAARTWHLAADTAVGELTMAAISLHAELAERRRMGVETTMPAAHFERIFRLPAIHALVIRDGLGIGGILVAARSAGETHLLHSLSSSRALVTGGNYILMQTAVEMWGRDGPVYFGGGPTGSANEGVVRFKQRWSNRSMTVSLLKAIFQPTIYRNLSLRVADRGYFPAYRTPSAQFTEQVA